MKIDLGFEAEDHYGIVAPSEPEKKTKTYYPTMTVSDQKRLVRAVQVGQEITAKVKLKVTEVTERGDSGGMYGGREGCRVEFDVLEMEPDMKIKEDDDEKDGGSAIKEYFRKKT